MGRLEKPSQGFIPKEQPHPSCLLRGHGQEEEPRRCQGLVETSLGIFVPLGILVLGKTKPFLLAEV